MAQKKPGGQERPEEGNKKPLSREERRGLKKAAKKTQKKVPVSEEAPLVETPQSVAPPPVEQSVEAAPILMQEAPPAAPKELKITEGERLMIDGRPAILVKQGNKFQGIFLDAHGNRTEETTFAYTRKKIEEQFIKTGKWTVSVEAVAAPTTVEEAPALVQEAAVETPTAPVKIQKSETLSQAEPPVEVPVTLVKEDAAPKGKKRNRKKQTEQSAAPVATPEAAVAVISDPSIVPTTTEAAPTPTAAVEKPTAVNLAVGATLYFQNINRNIRITSITKDGGIKYQELDDQENPKGTSQEFERRIVERYFKNGKLRFVEQSVIATSAQAAPAEPSEPRGAHVTYANRPARPRPTTPQQNPPRAAERIMMTLPEEFKDATVGDILSHPASGWDYRITGKKGAAFIVEIAKKNSDKQSPANKLIPFELLKNYTLISEQTYTTPELEEARTALRELADRLNPQVNDFFQAKSSAGGGFYKIIAMGQDNFGDPIFTLQRYDRDKKSLGTSYAVSTLEFYKNYYNRILPKMITAEDFEKPQLSVVPPMPPALPTPPAAPATILDLPPTTPLTQPTPPTQPQQAKEKFDHAQNFIETFTKNPHAYDNAIIIFKQGDRGEVERVIERTAIRLKSSPQYQKGRVLSVREIERSLQRGNIISIGNVKKTETTQEGVSAVRPIKLSAAAPTTSTMPRTEADFAQFFPGAQVKPLENRPLTPRGELRVEGDIRAKETAPIQKEIPRGESPHVPSAEEIVEARKIIDAARSKISTRVSEADITRATKEATHLAKPGIFARSWQWIKDRFTFKTLHERAVIKKYNSFADQLDGQRAEYTTHLEESNALLARLEIINPEITKLDGALQTLGESGEAINTTEYAGVRKQLKVLRSEHRELMFQLQEHQDARDRYKTKIDVLSATASRVIGKIMPDYERRLVPLQKKSEELKGMIATLSEQRDVLKKELNERETAMRTKYATALKESGLKNMIASITRSTRGQLAAIDEQIRTLNNTKEAIDDRIARINKTEHSTSRLASWRSELEKLSSDTSSMNEASTTTIQPEQLIKTLATYTSSIHGGKDLTPATLSKFLSNNNAAGRRYGDLSKGIPRKTWKDIAADFITELIGGGEAERKKVQRDLSPLEQLFK